MDAIKFVQEQVSKEQNYPKFGAGDNVVVSYKIVEGTKERIQNFRGDVIQVKGSGATVERIFPYACPNVVDIKVLQHGKVRRSRLYYLRDLVGKKARIKGRKFQKN